MALARSSKLAALDDARRAVECALDSALCNDNRHGRRLTFARALHSRVNFFRVQGEREGVLDEGIALDATVRAPAYIDERTPAHVARQSEASWVLCREQRNMPRGYLYGQWRISGESSGAGRGGAGGVGTGLGSARVAHHYTTTTVTVLALLLPISVSTALNDSAHHSR